MTITIPAPTAIYAYSQFFKNVGQLGPVILLIIFSGLLSQDISRGTLIVLLAKGLSRPAVIASKFTAALATWTAGYALAAVTAWGYTVYLFGSGDAPNLLFAFFSLWLFGAFLLSLRPAGQHGRAGKLRRAPPDGGHYHRAAHPEQLPRPLQLEPRCARGWRRLPERRGFRQPSDDGGLAHSWPHRGVPRLGGSAVPKEKAVISRKNT